MSAFWFPWRFLKGTCITIIISFIGNNMYVEENERHIQKISDILLINGPLEIATDRNIIISAATNGWNIQIFVFKTEADELAKEIK